MPSAQLHQYRSDADKYALASHIKLLKDRGPDEVRLWVGCATFDPSANGIGTIGYIVTAKRSAKRRISYPGRSTVPKKGVCRRYASRENPGRIVAKLAHLSSFSNFAIGCGVLDGDWVLIDAVSNGKRFVLWADNPESCHGDGARLVSRQSGRTHVARVLSGHQPLRNFQMTREIIRTLDAPSSTLFSQAVKAGSTVYLSGIVGIDAKTSQLAGSTIQDQTRQALINCENILRAAGAKLENVVDVYVLLAKPSDFAGLNEEYAKFFPNNPPARAVAKLGVEVPNVLVSIKMTAVI